VPGCQQSLLHPHCPLGWNHIQKSKVYFLPKGSTSSLSLLSPPFLSPYSAGSSRFLEHLNICSWEQIPIPTFFKLRGKVTYCSSHHLFSLGTMVISHWFQCTYFIYSGYTQHAHLVGQHQ
jgi:hypothetical protein